MMNGCRVHESLRNWLLSDCGVNHVIYSEIRRKIVSHHKTSYPFIDKLAAIEGERVW